MVDANIILKFMSTLIGKNKLQKYLQLAQFGHNSVDMAVFFKLKLAGINNKSCCSIFFDQ